MVEEDELHVEVEPRELSSRPPADELKVKVIFPEDKDLGGISYVDLQAKNSINNQDVFSVSNLLLKRSSETEGYNGKFKIRAKNVPPCDFYLKCSIKNEVWKTKEIKRNEKLVTVTFFKIHRPFTDRYKKPLVCVLATMMALILGGLSFVLYNNLRNENEQETALQEVFTRQDAYNFMNNVGQKLSERQLAFDTVDSLYNVYENHKDTIKKYTSKDICDYLCDYKKATDFVRKGDIASIKMVVNPQKKYKLYYTHLVVLKLIANADKIDGSFRSKFSELKSFDDIAKLYYVEQNSAKAAPRDGEHNQKDDTNHQTGAFEQFKCPNCKLWFGTNDELTSHQACACKKNKFKCNQCKLRFPNEKQLQQHKTRHKKANVPKQQKTDKSGDNELEYVSGTNQTS